MAISIKQVGLPKKYSEKIRKEIKEISDKYIDMNVESSFLNHWWWCAYEESRVIAVAATCPDERMSDIFVGPCCVIREYRGRGLQRRLISIRLKWARKKWYERALSITNIDNYVSSNNLIRAGFKLFRPWKDMDRNRLCWWRKL